MDMRKEWDRTNAARVAELADVKPLERANAHDRKQWDRFTGKTRLHRHINAYLCRQFYVTTNESERVNVCELEADAIMQMVEDDVAKNVWWQMVTTAFFAASALVIGMWIGCNV